MRGWNPGGSGGLCCSLNATFVVSSPCRVVPSIAWIIFSADSTPILCLILSKKVGPWTLKFMVAWPSRLALRRLPASAILLASKSLRVITVPEAWCVKRLQAPTHCGLCGISTSHCAVMYQSYSSLSIVDQLAAFIVMSPQFSQYIYMAMGLRKVKSYFVVHLTFANHGAYLRGFCSYRLRALLPERSWPLPTSEFCVVANAERPTRDSKTPSRGRIRASTSTEFPVTAQFQH